MDGQAQQLPRLGLLSWENSPVGLNEGDVTYLQGQEDAGATTSELHVYVGHKLRRGNAFDRAGLTNGHAVRRRHPQRGGHERHRVPHDLRQEQPGAVRFGL